MTAIEYYAPAYTNRCRGLIPHGAETLPVDGLYVRQIDEAALVAAEALAVEHDDLSEIAEGFSDACVRDNSIPEMVEALSGPVDATDCKTWGLSEAGWRRAIEHALYRMCQHVREYTRN